VVSATQALPNVTHRKGPALKKLLHVAKLVQEQICIERCMGPKVNSSPHCYGLNCRLTEKQSADAGHDSASPQLQFAQVGIRTRELIGHRDPLSDQ
jgi:hypothetical protein